MSIGQQISSELQNWQRASALISGVDVPAHSEQAQGLVKLLAWPDLKSIPDELVGLVIKVCALLWHKPTASFMVPKRVSQSKSEVDAVLRALVDMGYVQIIGASDMRTSATEAALEAEETAELTQSTPETATKSSFLARFWDKLSAR